MRGLQEGLSQTRNFNSRSRGQKTQKETIRCYIPGEEPKNTGGLFTLEQDSTDCPLEQSYDCSSPDPFWEI